MKPYFPLLIIVTVVFCWGCGEDTTQPGAELITSGWEKFEAKDYAAAQVDFLNALGEDSSLAEAYVGLGWSSLKTDQLAVASLAFSTALFYGAEADAYAGKAYADLNLDKQTDAIADVAAVVTITGNTATTYTFSHDDTITQTDLLWIKARAHFLLAQYDQAQIAVNVLSPGNNLNPSSPTYVTELAALIESLRVSV